MPCLYKTEIKESKVHGKGMYAMEFIPKGAIYWVWDGPEWKPVKGHEAKPNVIYTREQLENMEDKEKLEKILHCGFYFKDADLFIELNDGTEYNNHSEDWNSQMVFDEGGDYRKMVCVARKDILPGDEITGYYGNYMSSDAKWVDDLMAKYNPSRQDIEKSVMEAGNLAKNWKIE
jgi:SET domain-containing protein